MNYNLTIVITIVTYGLPKVKDIRLSVSHFTFFLFQLNEKMVNKSMP